jgi:hypothetical protein
MDIGYMIKFGRMVPGREAKALELFSETLTFWHEYLAKEKIDYFEPFLYTSGDRETGLGFFLVRGREEEIRKITEAEEYFLLLTKAQFVVEHLNIAWLLAGEEVMTQVERSAKVAPEFFAA